MRIVGQILRGIGLCICGLAALFYTGTLISTIVVVALGGTADTTTIVGGRILGLLFADLVFIAISLRLWKGLTRA